MLYEVITLLKLLRRGKNNAVCLPSGEQFFQVAAAFSLLRGLTQKIGAFGELPEKLIIQIVITSYSIHYTKLYDGLRVH